ncbi:hypothetical protein [Pseudoduganella violaceinigra]|uniref:hypothetical protein n=1 Tax=Pseudoduganella violaceinigra TaxID=246602 RepID=UPI0004004541|nr:hypothetical protein [Pseudoduganella violaceinigra]
MSDTRYNQQLALHVERGIELLAHMGAANAWIYMQSNHVPRGVILRVLAYPQQRRQSGASLH